MRLGYFNPKDKLLFHCDRVTEWLHNKNVYPIGIEVFPSNVCNQRCSFCSFKDYQLDKDFVNRDIFLRTISELSACGVKSLTWTGGGEPLCNPDIKDYISHSHYCNLEQGMFTNGVLLTEELTCEINRTHTWLRFSIDCATKETYQKIRGVDHFDKVINNIKTAINRKAKATIGTGFVITPDNKHEIKDFVALSNDLGVDYIQFKPMIQRFGDQTFLDVQDDLKEVSKDEKVMVNFYKYKDLETSLGRPYTKCYGHQFVPCISGSKVYPCNYMTFPEYELGDLHSQSFAEIWHSEKRKETTDRLPDDKCQLYCKCNEINKVLFNLKHQEELHQNFL